MKPYPFSNTTGGTIPAGAAMVPTGADANGLLLVAQPAADSSLFVLINGPADVPNGAYGVAFAWGDGDVPVGINAADEPYTAADTFGTKAGDWLLRKGKKGFRVVLASTQGMAPAMPDPVGVVPPPPPPPAVWSMTAQGELTTGTQQGKGRKTTNDGVGTDSGWYALAARPTLGVHHFQPYFANFEAGAGYQVVVSTEGGDQAANVDSAAYSSMVRTGPGNSALCFVKAADGYVSAERPNTAYIVAGYTGELASSTFVYSPISFGIVRNVSGVRTLLGGLDTTLSACNIGTFHGGILSGVQTPDTGTPASTDFITYCSGGVAKKCTLAAFKAVLDAIAPD